jgi:hypothetical protein
MQTRLRLLHVDELEVAVWLATTKDPPPAEWSEACAKLARSFLTANYDPSAHRILVVSDGGSPGLAQRKELYDGVFRGHAVPTAVVTKAMTESPVRRAMAAAMNLLKPHYRVFEPTEVLPALDHLGLARTRLDTIWMALRILQASLPPITTMRLIAEAQGLPLEPLRPSEIPPSARPPPK